MKNYTITVNGTTYDVTVEEKGSSSVAPMTSTPIPAAPKAEANKPASSGAGSVEIAAGAAGKVFKVEVNVGDQVKKGDTVIVLEAMKMEIPIVAPQDGTIASVDTTTGASVESGDVLATMD